MLHWYIISLCIAKKGQRAMRIAEVSILHELTLKYIDFDEHIMPINNKVRQVIVETRWLNAKENNLYMYVRISASPYNNLLHLSLLASECCYTDWLEYKRKAKEKYANHKPYTLLFQCSFQRMELFQAENLMQLLEQHGYMWKLDEPVREAWQQMDTGSVYWWLIMQQGV